MKPVTDLRTIRWTAVLGSIVTLVLSTAALARQEPPEALPRSPGARANFNVRADAFGVVFGIFQGGVDWKVWKTTAIGLEFVYWSRSDDRLATSLSVFSLGLRPTFCLGDSCFQDGWVISPFIRFGWPEVVNTGGYTYDTKAVDFGGVFAFQWVMGGNLNMQFGVGGAFSTLPASVTGVKGEDSTPMITPGLSGFRPVFEFNLGYFF